MKDKGNPIQEIWDEIARQFHEDMDNKPYGPHFHEHTEGIFNDRTGVYLLKARYEAWILRTTWGNNSQFCCQRPLKNPQNPIPFTQADAARALGCSDPAICRLTKQFVKQGRIHVDEKGRIFLNKKLKQNINPSPEGKAKYADSERIWFGYFPQHAKQDKEWDDTLEKGRAWKKWLRGEVVRFHARRLRTGNAAPAPVTGDLFGTGNESGSYTGNENAPAPVTPSGSDPPPSLDSRARPTLTSEQVNTLVSESVVKNALRAERDSLTEIRQAVEQAYGAPLRDGDGDAIPAQLRELGKKAAITTKSVCRWVYEFTAKKRAANYPITSPQLIAKSAKRDLVPWAKANALVVSNDAREEEQAAYYASQPSADACPEWEALLQVSYPTNAAMFEAIESHEAACARCGAKKERGASANA